MARLYIVSVVALAFWGSLDSQARIDVGNDAMEARELIHAIVSAARGGPETPRSFKAFKADHCDKVAPLKWVQLFLFDRPLIHRYRFSKGCDIDGEVTVTKGSFPVNLTVRNLGEIEKVKTLASAAVETDMNSKSISVKFLSHSGNLWDKKGNSLLTFDGNYKLSLDMSGETHQNQGGIIHITGFKGHSLDLQEPLHIR